MNRLLLADAWRARAREHRAAVGLAALLGSGLLAFALLGHPVEQPWTAERDDFVGGAETILGGALPRDPFRPLLYPVLVAATALLSGADAFLAGRIVSVLAATGLLLAAYALGRALADRATALLAALLVGVAGSWWTLGVQVNTDVLFALSFSLALLAALHALRESTSRAAALCGLALAASYFTRYAALALVPPAIAAVWLGSRAGERRARLSWWLLGTCAGLVPHVALTWRVWGRPFYDESWRSMAFRHFAGGDWERFHGDEFDGTWSVLRHDPATLLANIRETVSEIAGHELWRLLVEAPYALALAPPVVFGLVLCARRRPAAGSIVVAAATCYLGLVCVTFFGGSASCSRCCRCSPSAWRRR